MLDCMVGCAALRGLLCGTCVGSGQKQPVAGQLQQLWPKAPAPWQCPAGHLMPLHSLRRQQANSLRVGNPSSLPAPAPTTTQPAHAPHQPRPRPAPAHTRPLRLPGSVPAHAPQMGEVRAPAGRGRLPTSCGCRCRPLALAGGRHTAGACTHGQAGARHTSSHGEVRPGGSARSALPCR